jgi:hypothetical protein
VLGARSLTRFTLVAAVFAVAVLARVVVSTGVPSCAFSDRADLPGGGDSDDGDGSDLALPSHTASTALFSSPPRRLVVEAERAPATSAFASRIFRPPISALA